MWTSMVMEIFTVLLLFLLPLSRATQISDVPETFHGLISNGIKEFYAWTRLLVLQIPDKLKAIVEDEEQQKFVAQRLVHEFDKLAEESRNKLQEQFPEVYETLVGTTFRRFAGASLESKQEDKEKSSD
ncbi:Fatty-acid and retinol-binding protein 6 [Aphelenchoides besseyi]|nr:Fatty-acid and retinol-binding protein 6 [Aphelenchoides besseyi]